MSPQKEDWHTKDFRIALANVRIPANPGVIPLNRPGNYPKYNGAVEKGIREISVVDRQVPLDAAINSPLFPPQEQVQLLGSNVT